VRICNDPYLTNALHKHGLCVLHGRLVIAWGLQQTWTFGMPSVLLSCVLRCAGRTGTFVLYSTFLQSLHNLLSQPNSNTPFMSAPPSPDPRARAAPPPAQPNPAHVYTVQPPADCSRPAGAAAAGPSGAVRLSQRTAAAPPGDTSSAWPRSYAAGRLPIADKEPYPYFLQQEHRPHCRRDCDEFNKFHFGRLSQSREARAVTPKVGEEPLTRYEAEFARAVQRNRSASPAPRPQVRSKRRRSGLASPANVTAILMTPVKRVMPAYMIASELSRDVCKRMCLTFSMSRAGG
jgi:hypothetical protein